MANRYTYLSTETEYDRIQREHREACAREDAAMWESAHSAYGNGGALGMYDDDQYGDDYSY